MISLNLFTAQRVFPRIAVFLPLTHASAMKTTTTNPQIPGSRISGLVYMLSVTFPSWGGMLAVIYTLLSCGLQTSIVRDLWNG